MIETGVKIIEIQVKSGFFDELIIEHETLSKQLRHRSQSNRENIMNECGYRTIVN